MPFLTSPDCALAFALALVLAPGVAASLSHPSGVSPAARSSVCGCLAGRSQAERTTEQVSWQLHALPARHVDCLHPDVRAPAPRAAPLPSPRRRLGRELSRPTRDPTAPLRKHRESIWFSSSSSFQSRCIASTAFERACGSFLVLLRRQWYMCAGTGPL